MTIVIAMIAFIWVICGIIGMAIASSKGASEGFGFTLVACSHLGLLHRCSDL